MKNRNIGIVTDGATDYEIFKQLVTSILIGEDSDDSAVNLSLNFVELPRQSLHDAVMKYWKEANHSNTYYRPAKHAIKFQNEVAGLLNNAINDFQDNIEKGYLTHDDLLLIIADAEREFSDPNDYFTDWGISISNLLIDGINKFYHIQIKQDTSPKYLPLVIPLITFPSTEILIAAARGEHQIYGKKASDLKKMLYDTTNLSTLGKKELQENALDFLTSDGIKDIFKIVPESRQFLKTLFLAKTKGPNNK